MIKISMVPFWCLSFFLEEKKRKNGYPIIDEPQIDIERAKHKKKKMPRTGCEGGYYSLTGRIYETSSRKGRRSPAR